MQREGWSRKDNWNKKMGEKSAKRMSTRKRKENERIDNATARAHWEQERVWVVGKT